jgi:hypothetical protein
VRLDLIGIFCEASGSLDRWRNLDLAVWEAIRVAGGKRWRIGDETSGEWRLLVGIASYSRLDLELAEELIRLPYVPNRLIEFFNVLDIKDMQSFDDYIPGMGDVLGTPVVGVWESGKLQRAAQGAKAHSLLRALIAEFRGEQPSISGESDH